MQGLKQSAPLTVTELTAEIKQLLEQRFTAIELEGEVSRLTRHNSGHFYFTIKDAHATIPAIIWRSAATRLKTVPEEGKSFIFSGHISLYEPQGRYQFVVRSVETAGGGKMAEEFERRKKLFAERGWFDPARKRAMPQLPRHIGIVTSPSAAAFEDVKKVLATRPAWLQLTLAPSIVQGSHAPASIAAAMAQLNTMAQRPDLILLVRGGGSMEDLWCFNDEAVVRAIVTSAVPVIAGIGHEIDTTLADFAADLRAATPSNAAELACPDRDTLRRRLPRIPMLQQLMQQRLGSNRHAFASQQDRLQHRIRLMQDKRHLDVERQHNTLISALRQLLRQRQQQLRQLHTLLMRFEPHASFRRQQQLCARMRHQLDLRSQTLIGNRRRQAEKASEHLQLASQQRSVLCRQEYTRMSERLMQTPPRNIESSRAALHTLTEKLRALSPIQVLGRGYTMAFNAEGKLISSARTLNAGDAIDLRFHDGRADAVIRTISGDPS